MPRVSAYAMRKFSEAGPLPQVLNLGPSFAVMLVCLQDHQELRAPEGDRAETVFTVLAGAGFVLEGDVRHEVEAGDVVHVMPGERKGLIAAGGELSIIGVRHVAQGGR